MEKEVNILNKEFTLFLISGGIAAISNILSRIIFNFFLPFSVSVVMAYLVGMIVAYYLMKNRVFRYKKYDVRSVLYFILINLFALLQTYIVSVGGVIVCNKYGITLYGYYRLVCHIAGVLVPVFSSYIGHKYLTFKIKEK